MHTMLTPMSMDHEFSVKTAMTLMLRGVKDRPIRGESEEWKDKFSLFNTSSVLNHKTFQFSIFIAFATHLNISFVEIHSF